MTQFWCFNGAMQTTAAPTAVATGTGNAIKTMLQVKAGANNPLRVKAWGISFDGSAAATPIKCELVETDVSASGLTAHVAAGVQPYQDTLGTAAVSTVSLGTNATGYPSGAVTEGSTTASKTYDLQFIAPTSQYVMLWPLGDEPWLRPGKNLRIRATAGAAVNAYCWIRWDE